MKTRTEIVVITGASSGIGRDLAERLAQEGYAVLAGVRKLEDAPSGAGITPFVADVTKPEMLTAALAQFNPLWQEASAVHLVNNAGLAISGPVEGVPLSRWREQFEVNVLGLVAVTQAFLPTLRARPGCIVNISSVSGLFASPFLGPYSASKFAVEAISDSLRRELKPLGVKVVLVEPGPVATPIWQKGLGKKEESRASLGPELERVYSPGLVGFERAVKASAAGAIPPRQVSSLILRVLRSPKPRARYVLGPRGTAFQMRLMSLLPTSWVDFLIARELR
jgi:NAD(P)-dependent dehydrogenase (short-subunit alcohol dehydrogenase family)